MNPKRLEEIHDGLAKELLRRVKDKTATAADLNVARAFLKDNNIEVGRSSTLAPLADALTDTLPFVNPEDEPLPKQKRA